MQKSLGSFKLCPQGINPRSHIQYGRCVIHLYIPGFMVQLTTAGTTIQTQGTREYFPPRRERRGGGPVTRVLRRGGSRRGGNTTRGGAPPDEEGSDEEGPDEKSNLRNRADDEK
jgi:hypothetical protein